MKKTMFAAVMMIGATFVQAAETPNLKVLTESTTGWVRNFNPWIGGRSDWAYESLMVFDLLDSSKEHPWLARGYELADDMMSIRVDLRKEVKWSDGEDFSADDVVFTIEYVLKHPEVDVSGLTSRVDSVTKIDDYAVRIYLKEPNAFAAYDILGESLRIVPEHIWSKIDSPAQASNINPVGTGPFTEIQRFNPQVYIQCRNPYYWNKNLKVDCLEFPQYSSNDAALELLAKGEIDWAGVFVPSIERTYERKHPNNKYWFPSNSAVKIALNYDTKNEGARKAFHSRDFRQAFNLAMDRDGMIMIGAYNYVDGGNPASALPKALWNWRDEVADSVWNETFQYDLDKARAILKSAGFIDVTGDGYVENPDGSRLRFRIQVPSGWTDWVNNASIAVEGLREVGIDATVVTPEVNAYAQNWQTSDFDATFSSGSLQASVWRFYDYTMHSRHANSGAWWSTSMHNYKNAEIDELIDTLSITLDPEKQRQLTNKIERIYAEEAVQVPLYNNGVWYLYNDSRFMGFANADNPIIFPAPFEGMSRIVHLMNIEPRTK
ncbi:peptide ABC transporter substrate-binding protein [Vibrio inusitatus NBRC 102082]|uniref:Peptide ABC transporter substrate-binding protein n=1 Tax=Vibrio inusitatus NBRC 102082 TaxID=1219070 RepID=A0A4Y3HRX4_9VIBR|nr:ABC transporter substrate-binding protein [Vibrio inusitatus]GEA49893.1 peptide ABC transporter substrate-binding protein [Vibrio inusitatus NBRC 102082]